MVALTNAAPENPNSFDGVEPVDMIASLEDQFDSLERSTEATLRSLTQSLAFGIALESQYDQPDRGMFNYSLEKFADVIPGWQLSFEDISNSSKKVWDRSALNLKKLQVDSIEYAKVINIGTDRLVERTNMLYEQSQAIKNEPYKKDFTLKSPKKFNIDGKYEPKDVSPIINVAMSTLNFYDKVFLKFMDSVGRLFDKLSFDHDFTKEAGVDFSAFVPKNWMTKALPVEKDDRFRVSAPLFRTPTSQGNRALYASGPPDTKTEEIIDWSFMVNTVRDFSFRYYTVKELRPASEEALVVEVERVDNVRQRLAQLLAISKKLQSRKGYESKLAGMLRKIQISGEKIRQKAGSFKAEIDPTDKQLNAAEDKEKQIKGRPAVSDIVQSVTLMINNVARMVTDYNNALAGILRTLGALTYVAELELKAYQPPLRKPTTDAKDTQNEPARNGTTSTAP